jgi:hypothetical protein
LGEPEIWEIPLFNFSTEEFKKAIVPITMNQSDGKKFVLHARNRHPGADPGGYGPDSDVDNAQGKPGKSVHPK